MSRRITTISLDQIAWEQSKHVGNLSAFVRSALQDHADGRSQTPLDYHNAMHSGLKICHPHKDPNGYCGICWPYGRPTKQEWLEYSRYAHDCIRNGQGIPTPPKQLPDRRKITNSYTVAQEESSQAIPDQVGIIRKIWRFIF